MKKEIMTFMVKHYGRTGLLIKKHSPEILMATGIVGAVTSTVLACKATLKVEDIISNAEYKKAKVENELYKENEERYSEKDAKKDLAIIRVQTGVALAKLYGPSATLGILSIGCLLGAHNIMRNRNVGLMVAYKAVEEMYTNYRKRVIEDHGAETDYMYHNGLRKEKADFEEEQENGKMKKVKKEVYVTDDTNKHSIYARFFDESCPNWGKNPEYNLMFLKGQQNYYNDMLKVRGHVFLNEVYDSLGFERTQAGALVGWVAGTGHDNFIDFGFYNSESRRFINGLERVILLDFNVDGVIYDLI